MRTLSDVFAVRGPLLPEGLRTLDVSPNRIVEPGMTIHAAFTFRNLGGGTASGFRVRFRLPEGLTYLVGTARIDETPLDEQGGLTTLLQTSGADIGEIPAGGERRVSLAYTVATTIENGTPITLQAAIASFDVPVIGSNIVRLIVRSRPVLQNPKTTLRLTPVREALPGEELQIGARVHNSGQSSAHDLVVLLPLPANVSYVPGSVTIEGRSYAGGAEAEPFGYSRPSVVAPTLGPGATLDLGYRVRIDAPLEDATPVTASGFVCSQEIAEFAFAPVTLKIPSAPSFAGDDTAFRVDCDDEVAPGQRLRLTLRAKNAGTARARNVALRISLPEGLAYTGGSLTIDGAHIPDRGVAPEAVPLGDLEPGRTVEIGIGAVVVAPVADGRELRVGSTVGWSKGQRKFERVVTARSAPHFPPAFNVIERESPRRVGPGDALRYVIALQNMGTDVATDVRLALTADPGIERLRIEDRGTEIALGDDGTIALDTLEPGIVRTLRVDARVAAILDDGALVRLHGRLHAAHVPDVELGAPAHVIASRPVLSAARSQIVPESQDALRPNRLSTYRLVIVNEGTDRGRDVRVTLQLPEELRLERVDDATRDGNAIVFGDIPAGDTREALIALRLVGTVSDADILTFFARVHGLNVVPFALDAVELIAHAEAAFAEGATLTSTPAESIDAGAEIAYTLSLRNCGDGAAKRLTARVSTLGNAVYAPGSTTVNGIALQDFAGTSPLMGENGLTLADVGAGVEVIARWRAIVKTPLPPGTAIEAGASVAWDDSSSITVVAEPVRVRSTSALPIIEPELPFSVLGAVAAPTRSGSLVARAENGTLESSPAYMELRPATPIAPRPRTNGSPSAAAIPAVEYAQLPGGGSGGNDDAATTVFLELGDESLGRLVTYLEQTRVGGLVEHLLTLRALFPDRAGGVDRLVRARLRSHRDLVSELADRLFIKFRIPDFPLEASDLETPELRTSLGTLIEELAQSNHDRSALRSGLRLTRTIDHSTLAELSELLAEAPAAPAGLWLVTAHVIGTDLERDGGHLASFAAYRDLLVDRLRTHLQASGNFEASLREPAPELDAAREILVRTLGEQQRVLR